MRLKLLPWDYGVRNLLRRPSRSLLTLWAMSTVVLLIFVVVGFIRGLETSLSASGDPNVVLVYSVGAEQNIDNSSIPARTPSLLTASLDGVQKRFDVVHASPELFLGTRIMRTKDAIGFMGLVRGVTSVAPLIRRSVRLTSGHWPGFGEVMVGRLVGAKLGYSLDELALGKDIRFEGRSWKIAGIFEAGGAALESEIWCPLVDLQGALKRQDLSVVALLMRTPKDIADVAIFCKERIDLELQAVAETSYFESLQRFYQPVRILAWTIVVLVAGSGIFACLTTMHGAVSGRVRELATLQAIGFRRRAILVSLVQESTVLAAAASLLAGCAALLAINGLAVRFTMGAFTLRIDGVAVIVGCGVGLLLGLFGAIPAAVRALRLPVVGSLKAI